MIQTLGILWERLFITNAGVGERRKRQIFITFQGAERSLRQCSPCWLSAATARASSVGSFSVAVTLVLCWSYRQHCSSCTAQMRLGTSHRVEKDTFTGISKKATPSPTAPEYIPWIDTAWIPAGHVVTEGACLLFRSQEMVDWFNAIRAARFHYLQVAFPGAGDEEVRANDSVTEHAVVELVAETRTVTGWFLIQEFIFRNYWLFPDLAHYLCI